MLRTTIAMLSPAAIALLVLSLLTGVVYPLAVWGVALFAFPHQAGGSPVERDGKVIGSELVAQEFTSPRYFWARPSAADYNAAASSGSNLAPSNPALLDAVRARIQTLRASAADAPDTSTIPMDLVTASGSGLDPHISVDAARWQAPRVARALGIETIEVENLIHKHRDSAFWDYSGIPRVNVLLLNLALDKEFPK